MIAFYFEHRGHGGVPSLIINFIEELNSMNYKVKLFCYRGDVIDTALQINGVNNYELIDLDETPPSEYSNYINADDVLVVGAFYLSLQYFFRANPRLFFYNVFPSSLVRQGFLVNNPISRSLNRQLIIKMLEKNSVVFMDDTGIKTLHETLGSDITTTQYLPVLVKMSPDNAFLMRQGNIPPGILRLSYVGRSVGWKNNSIKKILDDLKELQLPYIIIMTIVVDDKKSFEDSVGLDNYASEKLQLNILEKIPLAKLGEFLVNNSDVHFGMGTTALDGAKMGIPTVLIDFSYKPFPKNYGYRWLFETKNYCLGNDIEASYFVNDGKYNMKEILQTAFDKNLQYQLSTLCYEYVSSEHDIAKNAQLLVDMSSRSTFRLKDSRFYIPYYFGGYQKFNRLKKFFSNLFLKIVFY